MGDLSTQYLGALRWFSNRRILALRLQFLKPTSTLLTQLVDQFGERFELGEAAEGLDRFAELQGYLQIIDGAAELLDARQALPRIAPGLVHASRYGHGESAKISADLVLVEPREPPHSNLHIGEDAMREACYWRCAVKH